MGTLHVLLWLLISAEGHGNNYVVIFKTMYRKLQGELEAGKEVY